MLQNLLCFGFLKKKKSILHAANCQVVNKAGAVAEHCSVLCIMGSSLYSNTLLNVSPYSSPPLTQSCPVK